MYLDIMNYILFTSFRNIYNAVKSDEPRVISNGAGNLTYGMSIRKQEKKNMQNSRADKCSKGYIFIFFIRPES